MRTTISVALTMTLMGCVAAKEAAIDSAMNQIWNEGETQIIDDNYEPELAHEVKRFVSENRALYPDLKVTIEDHVIVGNRYVTQWAVTGTHRDLDKPVTLRGVSMRTRSEGMFVQEEMFYDLKDVYDQLGFRVLPPDGVSPFDGVAAADRDGTAAGATTSAEAWPSTVPDSHRADAVKKAVLTSVGEAGTVVETDCASYPCVSAISMTADGWRETSTSLREALSERGFDSAWHWPAVVDDTAYAVLAFPAGSLDAERYAQLEGRMHTALEELTAQ